MVSRVRGGGLLDDKSFAFAKVGTAKACITRFGIANLCAMDFRSTCAFRIAESPLDCALEVCCA